MARLRIIDVGSGDDPSPFGVATIYEPLRDWIAKQIDDIGAAAQTRNVKEVLLPLFNRTGVVPKEISDRYTIWMESSERFSTVQQLQEREYIKETLDGSEPAHVQRESACASSAQARRIPRPAGSPEIMQIEDPAR